MADKTQRAPQILSAKVIANTKLFTVESVKLRFANAREVTYERLNSGVGVVFVVAIERDKIILVREYAVGTERYELGFVKGRIDRGETPRQAARRELAEEIGRGATTLTQVRAIAAAPGHTTSRMHIFIADGLYPRHLDGDEVEPLQQVQWPLADIAQLYQHPHINDARALLALLLVEKHLLNNSPGKIAGNRPAR